MPVAVEDSTEVLDALARVNEFLNLEDVRRKLADPEEGKGYDRARLDLMEQEYRRFLALHLGYPGADIVPCEIVDELWHQHILDTRAYREDCERLFGRFLEHYPYFGMNGPEDAQALDDAYADTLERYRRAFGEPPAATWVSAEVAKKCRTACKPMRCR